MSLTHIISHYQKKSMIIGIQFGRKGSQGLPGKNKMNLAGQPLYQWSAGAMLKCTAINKYFISTDDEEIEQALIKQGFLSLPRPAELLNNEALLESSIQWAAHEIRKQFPSTRFVVITLCNAPTVTDEVIEQGIKYLEDNHEFDSATTVAELGMFSPERARTLQNGSLVPYVPFENFGHTITCDRKDHLKTYFADGGATIVRIESLLDLKDNLPPFKWMGKKIYPLVQPAGGSDLDYEWQVPVLEWWVKKYVK
jgi:CMP-N-acetylneuraminic acid synthetase